MPLVLPRYVGLLSTSLLILGCAAEPPRLDYPPWDEVGYVGFRDYVDRKAGPAALNCGFFETMNRRRQRSYEVPGFSCVGHAVRNGIPFKYGTVRIPEDSYAFEVLVRDANGHYWDITYDVMLDGDAPQQWVKRCEVVKLDRRFSTYEVNGCESVVDW